MCTNQHKKISHKISHSQSALTNDEISLKWEIIDRGVWLNEQSFFTSIYLSFTVLIGWHFLTQSETPIRRLVSIWSPILLIIIQITNKRVLREFQQLDNHVKSYLWPHQLEINLVNAASANNQSNKWNKFHFDISLVCWLSVSIKYWYVCIRHVYTHIIHKIFHGLFVYTIYCKYVRLYTLARNAIDNRM